MSDIGKLAVNLTPPRLQGQRASEAKQQENVDKSKYYPRRRAMINIIPDTEELARLIDRALNALSQGVYWDRGSIVNILL
jgi:hypothetical protein